MGFYDLRCSLVNIVMHASCRGVGQSMASQSPRPGLDEKPAELMPKLRRGSQEGGIYMYVSMNLIV